MPQFRDTKTHIAAYRRYRCCVIEWGLFHCLIDCLSVRTLYYEQGQIVLAGGGEELRERSQMQAVVGNHPEVSGYHFAIDCACQNQCHRI